VDVLGHAADVWGSKGREFKSRQPDGAKHLVKQRIHQSKYSYFMIIFFREMLVYDALAEPHARTIVRIDVPA
jgi:hypothetical protein